MTETTVLIVVIICLAGWWAGMIFDVITTKYRPEDKTDPLFMRIYGLAFVIGCYGLVGLLPT